MFLTRHLMNPMTGVSIRLLQHGSPSDGISTRVAALKSRHAAAVVVAVCLVESARLVIAAAAVGTQRVFFSAYA